MFWLFVAVAAGLGLIAEYDRRDGSPSPRKGPADEPAAQDDPLDDRGGAPPRRKKRAGRPAPPAEPDPVEDGTGEEDPDEPDEPDEPEAEPGHEEG